MTWPSETPWAWSLAGESSDLELFFAAADGSDLGDAGHGEEPAAHDRVGGGAQFHGCVLVRGEREEEDFAHDGGDGGEDGALHFRRQFAGGDVDLLADNLAGGVDVGAPTELHPDDGEADGGGGADAADAGGAVDGGLDGEGDLALHLGGSHAAGFGDDGDGGGGEVGEDVDRHADGDEAAGDQEEARDDEDGGAIAQRPTD